MSDTFCGYDGNRDEVIVAYIYGELSGAERTIFTRHLTRCVACQLEIDALGDVRADLAEWTPPDTGAIVTGAIADGRPATDPVRPGGAIPGVPASGRSEAVPAGRRRQSWHDLPAWAQFAAAMLFMGMAAGVANLDITYDREGFAVHTGWIDAAPTAPAAGSPAEPLATRSDLATLAEQLRAELHPSVAPISTGGPSVGTSDDEIVRRLRTLIRESEQRQKRELALRVAEVAHDAHIQRQADLVRIDRTLGALQSTTGTAVRRQEQLLNNLAVRVSQRQPQQ